MADGPCDNVSDDLSEGGDESASVEECLSKANTYKASGNDFYKQMKFKESSECYENGITWLKKIPSPDASQKQLLSILYSNLCASYIETSDYTKARESADSAIENNKDNVKVGGGAHDPQAYYRRAQALFNKGFYEEALSDCNHLLALDRSDANVNNLVRRINQKIKEAKQDQKKGEAEMDFESWEKFEREEEEKKEQERTNKVKAEDEVSKTKAQVDEAPEFDEEDEKIMMETKKMGYCYFGKKKEEGAPAANSNHTAAPVAQPVAQGNDVQDASKRAISSWNAQGTTYEEKDMTQWCKRKLEELLMEASYVNEPKLDESGQNILDMFNDINLDNLDGGGLSKLEKLAAMVCKGSVRPSSVEALEGDAQIAFIRGTRRYLFDFTCNVNLKVTVDTSAGAKGDEAQLSTYEGVLALKEVSSEREAGKTWKDYMTVKYNSDPKAEHQALVRDMLEKFKESVAAKIDEFLSQYKTQ